MNEYEALVEWQGKSKVLREKPALVALCPPKIPSGVACNQTSATALRGWQMNAWAMAQPDLIILIKFCEGYIS
jgi:hypothetical protein